MVTTIPGSEVLTSGLNMIAQSLQIISDMTNYTTVILGGNSHENLLKQNRLTPEQIAELILTDARTCGRVLYQLRDRSMAKFINLTNVE